VNAAKVKLFVLTQWDRVGAWAAIGSGLVFLIVGYSRVQGMIYPGQQLPYLLSAGIGGLFLLGIGVMLWLSADMRDEWHKLDSIERAILEQGMAWTPAAAPERKVVESNRKAVAQRSAPRPAGSRP